MMEKKTQIHALDGRQDLTITRTFDLPLELLFKAYVEPEIVAHWMNTKVVKLDCQTQGSWRFETTDPMGNVHRFNGTFHEVVPNEKITRTFEMENSPFPVQIEYFTFERIDEFSSKLTMHIVYKYIEKRDEMLKVPFAFGINMAHNRLEEYFNQTK